MSIFTKAIPGTKNTVIYTDSSGKYFRYSGGTRAWRNHNPGNIRPGPISRKHHQIGVVFNFAIFPDYTTGHEALLDLIRTVYYGKSIDQTVEKFAPSSENNTTNYKKFLHNQTGVMDDRKIKDFTPEEFEKLWKGIEKIEGSKEGNVVEVYRITKVHQNKKGSICSYYLNSDEWVSKKECIDLAKQGKVELEVCRSRLGDSYLRAIPDNLFQISLKKLVVKILEG
jgi:hypothetical protein